MTDTMVKWQYPLSDIDLGTEEEKEVLKVLRSKWLSTGPVTERFEKVFSDYLGGGFALAVSNGTAALHLALTCMDLKRGDEVILPSLTFVATANAVLYVGGKPVFADIVSTEDLNISPQDVGKKVSKRTKAILVMHYGGYPCDMEPILTQARQRHLHVIEDAAHAPGAEYHGEKCGAIGEIGCFSFFSNKNLVTGEGGMVFTRNGAFAERMRRMRSHGMKALSWDKYRGHLSSYEISDLGYNYRTTEVQSALGLVQLKKLVRNNLRRKKLVEVYRKELKGIEEITTPFSPYSDHPSYHLLPILIDPHLDRERVMEGLRHDGIQTSIHYPPVHLFSLYRKRFGYQKGMLPKTEEVSRREVTLPLHPRMDVKDVKWIVGKLRDAVRKM
jgi:dTDP-4-amino-4,6-dideoxygalactose transaminase